MVDIEWAVGFFLEKIRTAQAGLHGLRLVRFQRAVVM